MAVKIQISGQDKVVADVIPTGLITLISDVTSIYTGSDWLECDGSAVSRTVYADLFAVIGTTFGPGDGSTTFNLPNANPTLITGAYTFSAFLGDTVVSVDNTSSISINISAGAVRDGVRITIIHQSTQELTITTGTDMDCVLSTKGTLVLVWDDDGSQWCLVGENVRIQKTFTSNGTWKTPFAATYKLSPVGGGGGGGGANAEYGGVACAGGGAGGSCNQVLKYEPAGTTLTVTIGAAGSAGGGNGGNGGNTTISDGTTTFYGMGGGGGTGASASGSGFFAYGTGGAIGTPATQIGGSLEIGFVGEAGVGTGGRGGNGACGAGKGGAGGASGTGYGGGGGGGSVSGSGSTAGGAGTLGVAYIEY